jgi:transcriptional regulator with XRE-family HTH domain
MTESRRGDRATEVSGELGARIRALRLQQGLSLRAVASVAEVSSSLLSHIERGEASPSLASLVAIADALGTRPGGLLDDLGEDRDPSPVVRREQRIVVDDEACRREFMMHLDDPYLDVIELAFDPGGEMRPHLARHSGRDYGLVLSGQVVVEFEDTEEVLRRGDYIAFDAERSHRVLNRSSRPSRLLWIIAHDRSEARTKRRANLRVE